MRSDQVFPEWRDINERTKYPFSETATLQNRGGDFIPYNMFLDARFYPPGGRARQYLSSVVVDGDDVTLGLSDETRELAFASFSISDPPSELKWTDRHGRPCGVTVSPAGTLSLFGGWSQGEHKFRPGETEFVASVVVPSPQPGLRGIVLDDGSFFSGDIRVVGVDGVVFAGASGKIVMNVVGEPLFKRKICFEIGSFETPRFVLSINGIKPDEYGNFGVFVGTSVIPDPVLRIEKAGHGIRLVAVGSLLQENTRISF